VNLAMKNKGENTLWWLILGLSAVLVVAGVAFSVVRQNNLNRCLLEAIQRSEGTFIIQDLIHQGADPNTAIAGEGNNPIFEAATVGSPEMVQVLLKAGASVQQVGPTKTGPIFAVAFASAYPEKRTETECRAIIQMFQQRGESIEERDILGYTPLMRAAWSGNIVAAKALLDLGANTHAVNSCGQTVWDWTGSIPSQQAEFVKLLREHDAGLHKN